MTVPASGPSDLAAAFLSYLESERAYSKATKDTYGRDLVVLEQLSGARPPATLKAADIRSFAARLHQQGLQPRSIARALSAWRSFFNWACRRQGFMLNPATGIRAPKAARGLPKALSVDHAGMLLDAAVADPHDPQELRDRACSNCSIPPACA